VVETSDGGALPWTEFAGTQQSVNQTSSM